MHNACALCHAIHMQDIIAYILKFAIDERGKDESKKRRYTKPAIIRTKIC